jgi:photosystem II stability/assembly factor-like uncharacterized protein
MRYKFALILIFMTPWAVAQDAADGQATETATGNEAQAGAAAEEKAGKVDTGLLASAMTFRSIGPAFMSGRIGDVAVDQEDPNTWYIAVASGGVWKTTNAGTTFEPIFDDKPSYSIGCVTIDPSVHTTVWVGTGENNGGRHIGFGDGVYVSHDSGSTWQHKGLKHSEHISKILVDPRDSDVVFVAAQGPLWSTGGERGLYKTTDGGSTWKNVLSVGELETSYTGVTDVVFDPTNPDVLYAATHQRHRNVWAIINCGPESGIHKSTDGGETWTKLGNGLPGGDIGKTSLQVSPQKPNVVYATIELPGRKGGFWRSEDYGASWKKTSDFVSGGTGPHYYQELWADPHRFGVLYQANNYFSRSEDNGETWENIEGANKHVDNHAVAFHPTDKDFLLVGCDGGVYRSYDYCETWAFCANLPLTQFYKLSVDNDYPFYNVAGGTQDNNSQYGPTATANTQGILNSDWRITIGGDGHDTAIDPEDPNTIYAESQQGFVQRFDRKTGESVSIQPQPEAGQAAFRFNWDTPIFISPHSHTRVYVASQYLHRSDDRGDSWQTVSPDLSRNQNRYELPTMGRVHSIDGAYDLYAMSQYGNITSISESPLVEGLLYVGTDDGLIQISEDGGANWRKVDRIFGVPEYFFVNDIKADLHDPDTVYACVDDHKTGDYSPYVIRSTDRGRTWDLMNGDLPEKHICWRIVQDHVRADLFFLATEFGIFCTLNAGESWFQLKSGLPTISFRDLEIQQRENDLVGASFGRSFYVLDDYSLLREATPEVLNSSDFHMFPVRRAFWYVRNDNLGGPKGYQGDGLYSARNPDYGVVFRYYIREGWKSKQAQRKEAEAKINKAGGDVPTATFEQLRAEADEQPPRHFLSITDAAGTVVATVDLSTSKGIHKTTWSMRVEGLAPNMRRGPLVAPGTYTAQAFKTADGTTEALSDPISFELESIIEPTLELPDRNEIIASVRTMGQLANTVYAVSATLNERQEQVQDLLAAIKEHPNGTAELISQGNDLTLRLGEYERKLTGDPLKSARWVQSEPGISSRLQRAMFSAASGTHGPTQTARDQFEIASQQFAEIKPGLLKLIGEEVEAFQQAADDAGIPWTSGRRIQ